jgi:hypothetical protein
MGTWAGGNFQNDGALDYLGGIIDGLVARVEEILADKDRALLDEEGESVLMPSVHIIALLSEQCGGAPPKPAQVQKWRKKYLAIFDEQIEGLAPQGSFEADRRKVIADTFSQLEQRAKKFWKK